ncbi:hypothetical protein F2Q69_00055214 [Brassica cretica]|uniref:Uncharacterized protein n=1 Tax=Brassica cretica TaxID=69181 RepID=A0A8S9MXK9_BRACR|nr:hypothetical protein F2Q69_00055214 [Brassica cretica]
MSLLWKKPKSGRLSRFMSEFHQSLKCGGIMVVETGFPTSLIDLFFKNRDRLKKYSSKTKRIQRLIETAPNASLPVNPDVSLEKPVTRSKIEKVSLVGRRMHTSDNNVCVCGDGTGAFVLMAFKLFYSGGAFLEHDEEPHYGNHSLRLRASLYRERGDAYSHAFQAL